jgi:hypothetical protein
MIEAMRKSRFLFEFKAFLRAAFPAMIMDAPRTK